MLQMKTPKCGVVSHALNKAGARLGEEPLLVHLISGRRFRDRRWRQQDWLCWCLGWPLTRHVINRPRRLERGELYLRKVLATTSDRTRGRITCVFPMSASTCWAVWVECPGDCRHRGGLGSRKSDSGRGRHRRSSRTVTKCCEVENEVSGCGDLKWRILETKWPASDIRLVRVHPYGHLEVHHLRQGEQNRNRSFV